MHKIKELEIKDFRSWKNLLIEDFDAKKLCLISGRNGGGKSSLMMALEYLLTDRLIDSTISVNDLPKRPGNSFYLRCIIECENGKKLEIIKSRGDKYDNTSSIFLDGVDISSTTRKETQQKIFDILGINRNTLPYSTIFTQNSPSFVDTADTERKNILYDFLDLYKYNDYLNIVKSIIAENIEEVSIRKQKIENILDNLIDISDNIEEYKIKKKNFEVDKLNKIQELEEDKNNIKEEDTKWIDAKIKEQESKIVNVTDTEKIEEEVEKTKETLTELRSKKTFLLSEMESIEDNVCPILDIHCNILDEKKNKIQEKNKPKLEEIEKKIEKLSKKLSDLLKKLDKINDTIYANEEIEDEISDLKHTKELIQEKNKNVRNSITSLEKRIQEIKNEKNPYIDILKKLRNNKISQLNKKREHEEKIEKLNELLKYYKFWERGFGREGIPNLKIEYILGTIEDYVNNYLSNLSGNMSAKIESQTKLKDGSSRERIQYKINTPTGEVDYSTFSGGEKQRIKLANILAFADIMRKFNVLILDEVLDLSLDEAGSKDVMNLLKQKTNDFGSIFVMSHKTEIKDGFDNVIEVEKL